MRQDAINQGGTKKKQKKKNIFALSLYCVEINEKNINLTFYNDVFWSTYKLTICGLEETC
jgi:hypothetical protein